MNERPEQVRPRRAQIKGAVASGRTIFSLASVGEKFWPRPNLLGGNSAVQIRNRTTTTKRRRTRRISAISHSSGRQKPRARGIVSVSKRHKASLNVTYRHAVPTSNLVAGSKALRKAQRFPSSEINSVSALNSDDAKYCQDGGPFFCGIWRQQPQLRDLGRPMSLTLPVASRRHSRCRPAGTRQIGDISKIERSTALHRTRIGRNPASKPLKAHSSTEVTLRRSRSDG